MTGASLLALMFLALFVPSEYQDIKVAFLLLALAGISLLAIYSKLVWSSETLLSCLLLATFGAVNSLHGQMNSAAGAVRVLSVMAVWPILFAVLSGMLNRPDAIRMIVLTLKMTLIVLLAYFFLFLGYVGGIVPDAFYLGLSNRQGVGFHDGSIEVSMRSTASLLFLMPFYTHYLLKIDHHGWKRLFNWALVVIGLLMCVLTGRRAVQVVVFMSPFLIVMAEALVGGGARVGIRLFRGLLDWRSVVIVIVGGIALLSALARMDVRLDTLVDYFMSGFNFDDISNPDVSERVYQFRSLTHSWVNGNVLFGAGNGSHADYVRVDDMPWQYELTYVYLLFSTGIAGVLFYFGWFAWGLLRIRAELIQRDDMAAYVVPLITGVLGFGIGAASNPYFAKFDYLWIILLPHLLAGALRHQSRTMAGKYVSAG
jgi:hypothetical protein